VPLNDTVQAAGDLRNHEIAIADTLAFLILRLGTGFMWQRFSSHCDGIGAVIDNLGNIVNE
jgi:hypothetical protein